MTKVEQARVTANVHESETGQDVCERSSCVIVALSQSVCSDQRRGAQSGAGPISSTVNIENAGGRRCDARLVAPLFDRDDVLIPEARRRSGSTCHCRLLDC